MKNSCFLGKKRGNIRWMITFSLIIIVAWYISTFHYQLLMIQGNSMLPSFQHLQIVILDKQSKEFRHGDVIAFQCDGLDAILIKRVVASPGDTVYIKDGMLFVNDEISKVYGADVIFEYAGIVEEQLLLAEGQYFTIGDNVVESKDSRYKEIGIVKSSNIRGKIIE